MPLIIEHWPLGGGITSWSEYETSAAAAREWPDLADEIRATMRDGHRRSVRMQAADVIIKKGKLRLY